MFEEINWRGEAATHQYECHNPICIRLLWISYLNICPTCGFSGVLVEDWEEEEE